MKAMQLLMTMMRLLMAMKNAHDVLRSWVLKIEILKMEVQTEIMVKGVEL